MKLHRFFIENLEQPLGEELKIKEKPLIHQWNNVLKFKKQEEVSIFNGKDTFDHVFSIENINNKEVDLKFLRKTKNISQKDSKIIINLCFSLVKKEKIALIIEKCTELGVLNFISLISERTEKKNIDSFNKERLVKVAEEAAEQSLWGSIPNIHNPEKLNNLLKNYTEQGFSEKILVLDINNQENPKNKLSLIENIKKQEEIYIFIGPEGGWTEKEREIFKKYNLNLFNFGENTLKAETAAIASVAFFKNINLLQKRQNL